MSDELTFVEYISDGIQDVSSFLPLLGTEQCDKHVGAALENGYIYAAAAPLSIFGSLGIVKTAFTTIFATTTKPFSGGSWLHDVGFAASGSATSMAMLAKGTKRYGAEVNLQRLLKEQNLEDPDLVSDIEWFGWRDTYVGADGVDIAGLALQLRIHRITRASLLLMQARHRYPLTLEEAIEDSDALLEVRLRKLDKELRAKLSQDPEKRREEFEEGQLRADRDKVTKLLYIDLSLLFFHSLLVVGICLIIAGYIGCFSLVSRSDAKGAPFVWVGLETFLCFVRFLLWGWNPSWDEGNTGLVMRLQMLGNRPGPPPNVHSLSEKEPSYFPESSGRPMINPSTPLIFPLVTTPHHLSQLTTNRLTGVNSWYKEERESFIADAADSFLAAATPYIGPLRRLQLENVSLFYAIVPEVDETSTRKLFCVTARRNDSEWASVSLLINGTGNSYTIYSSHSRNLSGTHALLVTLDNKIMDDPLESTAVMDPRTLGLIIEHSYYLFVTLLTPNDSPHLDLMWTVNFPLNLSSRRRETPAALTKFDEEYMRLRQICDLKHDYCFKRGSLLFITFDTIPAKASRSAMLECVIMFESIILEAHLCIMEHRFVESMGLSPAASRPLVLEWIRKMEARISMQKETCRRRHSSWGHGTLFKFDQTWDTLMRELRSLRQLPSNSTVLQTWQELIDAIVGTSKPPSASLLLETSPFTSLILLTSRLLPIFQDSEGAPTRVYKDAIDLVRSTLRRLQGGKPDRSFGRMELFPPGSPEFSPPYTRVYKPSDLTVKTLSEQLDSVRMLELELVPSDVLHLLDSLPQSLPSLTSLVIRDRVRSLPSEPNFLTQTLPSILRKHQNIVSLQLGEGERIDKEATD
ncbi:hypothetical protein AAF712_016381, partial [Marasmius tenuissimus]